MKKNCVLAFLFLALLMLSSGCNRSALTGSKLTLANYDQVTNGMTKAQVERIMGAPKLVESKRHAPLQTDCLSLRGETRDLSCSPLRTTSSNTKIPICSGRKQINRTSG